MKKLLTGRVLFAVLFVVVFAILIVTAMGYNTKARTMPLLVSIPVFLGACGNLYVEARASLRGEKAKKEKEGKAPANVVAVTEKAAVTAPALEMATAGGATLPAAVLPAAAPVVKTPVVKPEKKKKEKLSEAEKAKRELIGAAWIIGYVIAVILIGFPLGPIGYMVAFLKLYSKESWKLTLVYTALLIVFIWTAFVIGLKSNLYNGIVFDALEFQGPF